MNINGTQKRIDVVTDMNENHYNFSDIRVVTEM